VKGVGSIATFKILRDKFSSGIFFTQRRKGGPSASVVFGSLTRLCAFA